MWHLWLKYFENHNKIHKPMDRDYTQKNDVHRNETQQYVTWRLGLSYWIPGYRAQNWKLRSDILLSNFEMNFEGWDTDFCNLDGCAAKFRGSECNDFAGIAIECLECDTWSMPNVLILNEAIILEYHHIRILLDEFDYCVIVNWCKLNSRSAYKL